MKTKTQYEWDRWEQEALSRKISESLAKQGRAVLREYQNHAWEGFGDEINWGDMLQLAIEDPEFASDRWLWLELSDGEKALEPGYDSMTEEEIERFRTPRRDLAISAFGWYGAGWACFKSDSMIPGYFPLGDDTTWKEWLDGFAGAYADYPDEKAAVSILTGDGTGGESFDDALVRVLGEEKYGQIIKFIES